MKTNKNDKKTIISGEQMPKIILRNLKILGKDVIKFSVKDMVLKQAGVVKETCIYFEPDKHGNAIGVIKPKTLDEETLKHSCEKIDKTVSMLSLFYSVGDWKQRLPINLETRSMLVMEPRHLKAVDNAFKSISNKMNEEESEVYFRALEWYRHGINSKSPFNRFLAFYTLIELFSEGYFYSKNRSEIRMSRTEKDNCIKKYFQDRSITSISEVEREHINECFEKCIQISTKDMMMLAFKTVFDGNNDKISEFSNKFFEEEVNFRKIRNNIAHGDLSEYRQADRTLVEDNLFEIRSMAKDFLTEIISTKRG